MASAKDRKLRKVSSPLPTGGRRAPMSKLTFENVYAPVDDETFEHLLEMREKIFARMVARMILSEERDGQCQESTPSQPKTTF